MKMKSGKFKRLTKVTRGVMNIVRFPAKTFWMPKILALVFSLAFASTAYCANFHWKFGIDLKQESISDGEQKFVIDDWVCTVGPAKEDKAGAELRRLGCGIGDGLQVYILPLCFKDKKTGRPKSNSGILNLQLKHSGSKTVSLTCE
mgnify:CR=1 FL=1